MQLRATITLADGVFRMHTRPCALIAAAIQGAESRVVFARVGQEFVIDSQFPMVSVMTAVAGLGIQAGTDFQVSCDGRDAPAVFERLRALFRSPAFPEAVFAEESV